MEGGRGQGAAEGLFRLLPPEAAEVQGAHHLPRALSLGGLRRALDPVAEAEGLACSGGSEGGRVVDGLHGVRAPRDRPRDACEVAEDAVFAPEAYAAELVLPEVLVVHGVVVHARRPHCRHALPPVLAGQARHERPGGRREQHDLPWDLPVGFPELVDVQDTLKDLLGGGGGGGGS